MSHISDRLLSSAEHIGEMPSGALLLKDNAHYPWFMIVPDGGDFVEWIDLPAGLQEKMQADINTLSKFLLEDPELKVGKTNVAAIGNIVPQFHLHIIGRIEDDPAWPAPVWGHPDSREYEAGELEALVARLDQAVAEFTIRQL
ncbi:MAG: HIT domain-containing protein [Verrucomicrobiales bacterium]|nr:HIT domain-containing protein [Verrucomicrobiales bacterium]